MTSSTDPFTDDVHAPSQDIKTDGKAFHAPPKLTAQPSGKLAHRCQATAQLIDSPTPKVPSHCRGHVQGEKAVSLQAPFALTTCLPCRVSLDLPSSFPICDDSSDFSDNSDITREASTIPAKLTSTWQQDNFVDDGPHTTPLASTYCFPLAGHSPYSTPTPAQHCRNHRCILSEGVFAMLTDEDYPSASISDLFKSMQLKCRSAVSIPRQRCNTVPAGLLSSFEGSASNQFTSSSTPPAAGYFAGSVATLCLFSLLPPVQA